MTAPDPTRELMEKLRFHGRFASETQDECAARRNREREIAAEAITRLLSEKEALEKELAEARKALEPFAEASRRFDEAAVQMGFEPSCDEYSPRTKFTHAQLRAARRASHAGGGDGN